MKRATTVALIFSLAILMIITSIPTHATNSNVSDPLFLSEINPMDFEDKKDEAYYKISVNQERKTIQLKLSIRDENFGKNAPEVSILINNIDGTLISIPSSQIQMESKEYNSVSFSKYSKNSNVFDYNIEINFLSPTFNQVTVSCVVLGETYKVCDNIELGFDFSPPTKPTKTTTTKPATSEKVTTTKPEKTATTKTTTEKVATTKSANSNTTNSKAEKTAKVTSTKQGTIQESLSDGVDSSQSMIEQQPDVTKLDNPPMNKKAKVSLALAGCIGAVAIVTIATALVQNNKVRKEKTIDKDESDVDDN